jgi:hypothetical protein
MQISNTSVFFIQIIVINRIAHNCKTTKYKEYYVIFKIHSSIFHNRLSGITEYNGIYVYIRLYCFLFEFC